MKVLSVAIALALCAPLLACSRETYPSAPAACGEPSSGPRGQYTGTAELKVLGTRNHQKLTLIFNETDPASASEGGNKILYCKGEGDTSHTVNFDYCKLEYHQGVSGPGVCELVLDYQSWVSSVCCRHHHLTKKFKNIRMSYADDPNAAVGAIQLTADVYTVWPLGWKGMTWVLSKTEPAT